MGGVHQSVCESMARLVRCAKMVAAFFSCHDICSDWLVISRRMQQQNAE